MSNFRLRFSLRTLLAVFTAATIAIAFAATHWRIVLGAFVMLMLMLQAAEPLISPFIEYWLKSKSIPRTKPPRLGIKPSPQRRPNL